MPPIMPCLTPRSCSILANSSSTTSRVCTDSPFTGTESRQVWGCAQSGTHRPILHGTLCFSVVMAQSLFRDEGRAEARGGMSTKRCVGLLFLCQSSTRFQGRLQTTPWTANLQNEFSKQNRFVDNNRSCRQSPSGTQTCFVNGNRFRSLRIGSLICRQKTVSWTGHNL
jgi:hypothetical protein